MSSSTTALPAKKQRKSTKSASIKSAVIARRVNGQSKNTISKDLGIGRNTVTTILKESNLEQAIADLQRESLGLVPKAITALHFRLDNYSESAAIDTLKNTIWPLNSKSGSGMKPGDQLFLSIQNLIQPQPVKPLESVIECVNNNTTELPAKP